MNLPGLSLHDTREGALSEVAQGPQTPGDDLRRPQDAE